MRRPSSAGAVRSKHLSTSPIKKKGSQSSIQRPGSADTLLRKWKDEPSKSPSHEKRGMRPRSATPSINSPVIYEHPRRRPYSAHKSTLNEEEQWQTESRLESSKWQKYKPNQKKISSCRSSIDKLNNSTEISRTSMSNSEHISGEETVPKVNMKEKQKELTYFQTHLFQLRKRKLEQFYRHHGIANASSKARMKLSQFQGMEGRLYHRLMKKFRSAPKELLNNIGVKDSSDSDISSTSTDGEKYEGKVNSKNGVSMGKKSVRIKRGAQVEVLVRRKTGRKSWCKGKITRVHQNNRVSILREGGRKENFVPLRRIRKISKKIFQREEKESKDNSDIYSTTSDSSSSTVRSGSSEEKTSSSDDSTYSSSSYYSTTDSSSDDDDKKSKYKNLKTLPQVGEHIKISYRREDGCDCGMVVALYPKNNFESTKKEWIVDVLLKNGEVQTGLPIALVQLCKPFSKWRKKERSKTKKKNMPYAVRQKPPLQRGMRVYVFCKNKWIPGKIAHIYCRKGISGVLYVCACDVIFRDRKGRKNVMIDEICIDYRFISAFHESKKDIQYPDPTKDLAPLSRVLNPHAKRWGKRRNDKPVKVHVVKQRPPARQSFGLMKKKKETAWKRRNFLWFCIHPPGIPPKWTRNNFKNDDITSMLNVIQRVSQVNVNLTLRSITPDQLGICILGEGDVENLSVYFSKNRLIVVQGYCMSLKKMNVNLSGVRVIGRRIQNNGKGEGEEQRLEEKEGDKEEEEEKDDKGDGNKKNEEEEDKEKGEGAVDEEKREDEADEEKEEGETDKETREEYNDEEDGDKEVGEDEEEDQGKGEEEAGERNREGEAEEAKEEEVDDKEDDDKNGKDEEEDQEREKKRENM
eukprot:g4652.t1